MEMSPGEATPPVRRTLFFLGRFLGEGTMGFLALVALALGIVPWIFSIPPPAAAAFAVGEWIVIALFAAEYAVRLALAPSKSAFVRNPWRLLDLAIILLPLLSLLPAVGRFFRSSPILRLLRLVRAVLFGARAGGRAVGGSVPRPEVAGGGTMRVSVLEEGASVPRAAGWDEFLQWAKETTAGWYHVSNLDGSRIEELAAAAGVPEEFLRTNVGEMARPRIEVHEGFTAFFLWLPTLKTGHPPSLDRSGVLLLTRPEVLVTLSRRTAELQSAAAGSLRGSGLPGGTPFGTAMTYAFARLVSDRYKEIVGRLEVEVRSLEEVPAREGSPGFFERAFGLERTLSQAKGDLWRLKGVFASLAKGRVQVQGARTEDGEVLRALSEEAESAHQESASLRENLLSLMDLHMNVASFEMNRVMRVLAVLSALGLVPAVIGGLLGMNLKDNPWPATLPQVAFGVGWAMLLALYVFYAKGWIR